MGYGLESAEKLALFLAMVGEGLFYGGLLIGFAGVITSWLKIQWGDFNVTPGLLYVISLIVFILFIVTASLEVGEMEYSESSEKTATFLIVMVIGMAYSGILAGFGFLSSRVRR